MTPELTEQMLAYNRVINIHSFFVVAGGIIPMVMMVWYLKLHIRLERASKLSQQLFPERWINRTKHRCLFSVRFTLLCLVLQVGIYVSAWLYPVPPFVGYEFLADKIWAIANHKIIPYYKAHDIASHIADLFIYILFYGLGGWVEDSIYGMTAKRRSDG